MSMNIVSVEIEVEGRRATVSGRSTLDEIRSAFGTPDDVGGFSRRRKRGMILQYGDTEFHFSGDKGSDRLRLIWREREVSGGFVPEVSIPL